MKDVITDKKQGPEEAAARKECVRCGTCCLNGGPALHKKDLDILRAGTIEYRHLVTIRAGETALTPLTGKAEPVTGELVKIAGSGGAWACFFLNRADNSCRIYENRPLECRLLKCWEPDELLAVIGHETIIRTDIINPNDPVRKLLEIQERECPGLEIKELIMSVLRDKDGRAAGLARLDEFVRRDLAIRASAVEEFGLPVEVELFLFGRPLFIILESHGFSVDEDKDGIRLNYTG